MLTVKKINLRGLASPKAADHLGMFNSLRDVKDHAWRNCVADGKAVLYLCFRKSVFGERLDCLLFLKREANCVRLETETLAGMDGIPVEYLLERHRLLTEPDSAAPGMVVDYLEHAHTSAGLEDSPRPASFDIGGLEAGGREMVLEYIAQAGLSGTPRDPSRLDSEATASGEPKPYGQAVSIERPHI